VFVPRSDNHIAYLAWNSIVIFNIEKRVVVSQFMHSEDEKLKDFCIVQSSGEMVILTVDFYGSVF
jgi:cytochrome c oxidase subunit IV